MTAAPPPCPPSRPPMPGRPSRGRAGPSPGSPGRWRGRPARSRRRGCRGPRDPLRSSDHGRRRSDHGPGEQTGTLGPGESGGEGQALGQGRHRTGEHVGLARHSSLHGEDVPIGDVVDESPAVPAALGDPGSPTGHHVGDQAAHLARVAGAVDQAGLRGDDGNACGRHCVGDPVGVRLGLVVRREVAAGEAVGLVDHPATGVGVHRQGAGVHDAGNLGAVSGGEDVPGPRDVDRPPLPRDPGCRPCTTLQRGTDRRPRRTGRRAPACRRGHRPPARHRARTGPRLGPDHGRGHAPRDRPARAAAASAPPTNPVAPVTA